MDLTSWTKKYATQGMGLSLISETPESIVQVFSRIQYEKIPN